MTPAEINAIKLRMETARKDLNDSISAVNGSTDETRSELMTEFETREKAFQDLERIYGTAVKIQDSEQVVDDAQGREVRTIESKVNLHKYLEASISKRSLDGAEAEFNSALGIQAGGGGPVDIFSSGDGTLIPLSLFAPQLETRAETDVDTVTRPRGWVDRLFAGTEARHLGLSFASVPSGMASFPVTKTGGTPAQRGRSQAAAAASWSIGVEELKPGRMSLNYEFSIEDSARIPMLESALRRDMRSALTERLDRVIFTGDSGADENRADIVSFFAQSGITAKTLTQANKVKYDKTLEALVDLLDGFHAGSLGDLRIVSAVGWNKLIRSTIANSTADSATIAKFLMDNGVTWRTRGGIETATGNGKNLAAIGLGRGIRGAGQVAFWNSAVMVRDPYSAAPSGTVKITMHSLWSWAMVRATNFAKLSAIT